MTFFQCGPCPKKKSATWLISPIHSTPRSNSRIKCHQKKKNVFFDTEVFKGPRFADNKTLDLQTHNKPTKTLACMHFSSSHPLSVKKGFIKVRNFAFTENKLG